MPRRPFRPAASPLLLLALLLCCVCSMQRFGVADEVEAEEERLEAAARHTERGWAAFASGNHEEVLARMERLARYAPESPLPFYLRARVFDRTGRYSEAYSEASAGSLAHPSDRLLRALALQMLLSLGRTEQAERDATAALLERPDELGVRWVLAAAKERRGARAEALAEYDLILEAWNSSSPPGDEIRYVAQAGVRVTWLTSDTQDDLIKPSLGLLAERLREHPDDHDAHLDYADIFRSDRGTEGQSLARKHYDQILKRNPEMAMARVGLARTALVFYRQDDAVRELERALSINPNLCDALAVLAAIHVGNGDYEKAEALLTRSQNVNGQHLETLSVLGALHHIRGETQAFAALRDRVFGINPLHGEFFVICADLVGERQRRYDISADLARKAIEIDPNDRFAYVALGEALMNRGRTDEALATFRIGVQKSKQYADVRRDNWIEVLSKWMSTFKVIETPNFRIRMPLSEAPVMRHYLPDLLEEASKVLTSKYGMTAEVPTHADSFDRTDDFSVRSVGTAGLPALGVCFGNVITLLGPTARPLGQFSWSRTAWHEFAHVVTLQLSEGQVPRWLTEGLSVFEEQERRARWGRDMELELYNRWRNGRLLKMAQINSAFRGPDIMFAYYQGGLIAAHLQQERGFAVIPMMLRAFAADRTTEQVFQEVLGLPLAEYDRMFEKYVASIVGKYRMVPTWDDASLRRFQEAVEKDPKDAVSFVRLAWAQFQRDREIDAGAALLKAEKLQPKHPEVLLLRGRMAEAGRRVDLATEIYQEVLAAGEDDLRLRLFLAERALAGSAGSATAYEHLDAAKRCFPAYIGKDSPYLQLAGLYRGERDMEKAIAELEAFAAIAAENYEVRKELKAWYLNKEDWAAVARVCEEMNDISPFGGNVTGPQATGPDLELHRDWEKALTQLGATDSALRELKVQVELLRLLPEEDQLAAGLLSDLLRLGERLLLAGEPEEALSQALVALRLAPDSADARMLKQRAQEASAGR